MPMFRLFQLVRETSITGTVRSETATSHLAESVELRARRLLE